MGAGRENKNLWWYLFTFWPNYGGKGYRWRGRDVFTKRWWRYKDYIWHDSIGKFWNRWVVCSVIGHRHVRDVGESNHYSSKPEYHCFNCERRVE